MDATLGDKIQLIIASIMFISVIVNSLFYYWIIKRNDNTIKSQFFAQLCKEEREIRKQSEEYLSQISQTKGKGKIVDLEIKANRVLLDFYEYIAILFFGNKIDDNMFYDYFSLIIIEPYLTFMKSVLFKSHQDRFDEYPYLTALFNKIFKLSIKKIPEDLKNILK